MKRFTVAFIAAAILLSNTVYAEESGKSYFKNPEDAGGYLAGVMEYINKNYVGSDVDNDKLVAAAVAAMASSLDDYSEFYTDEEYDAFIQNVENEVYATGFAFATTEDYPVITEIMPQSPAQANGLLVGDKITVINGHNTLYKSYEEVSDMLTNVSEPKYDLSILRNNKINEFKFDLEAVKVKTVFYSEMDDLMTVDMTEDWDEIGYIQITAISTGTSKEFEEAIQWARKKGMSKIILDLRGNSGGLVDEAVEICKKIVPEGRIMYTQDKTGSIEETFSNLKRKPFNQIAVLTNSMTASAAEIIASAIKESEAGFVVGQTTFGKGVVQTIASLPNLGKLKLTTMEYFSRNGNTINEKGVPPDIEVNTMYTVSKEDTLESDKIKAVFRYLGYKVNTTGDVKRSLATFQTKAGLKATVELDDETVNSLNLALYARQVERDDVLETAYRELLKLSS